MALATMLGRLLLVRDEQYIPKMLSLHFMVFLSVNIIKDSIKCIKELLNTVPCQFTVLMNIHSECSHTTKVKLVNSVNSSSLSSV